MLISNLLLIFVLFGLGLLNFKHTVEQQRIQFWVNFAYLTFYNLSWGPIAWLYIAEILCDKTLIFAVSLNLGAHIFCSFVPHVASDYSYLENFIYTIFMIIAEIVLYYFMIETRGKTPQTIKNEFITDPRYKNDIHYGLRYFESEIQNSSGKNYTDKQMDEDDEDVY